MQLIMTWVCGDKVGEWICDNEIFLEMGPDTDQLNAVCHGTGRPSDPDPTPIRFQNLKKI